MATTTKQIIKKIIWTVISIIVGLFAGIIINATMKLREIKEPEIIIIESQTPDELGQELIDNVVDNAASNLMQPNK